MTKMKTLEKYLTLILSFSAGSMIVYFVLIDYIITSPIPSANTALQSSSSQDTSHIASLRAINSTQSKSNQQSESRLKAATMPEFGLKVPSTPKSRQKAPTTPKSLQKVASSPESRQKAPTTLKPRQKAPTTQKSLQKAPTTPKYRQKAPTTPKSPQKVPSTPGSRQKAPTKPESRPKVPTTKSQQQAPLTPPPPNFLNMSKTVISPHDFKYIINNPELCSKNKVTVIILVHTATYNFKKRDEIRQTWASVHSYQDFNYRTAFMLAKTTNQTVQDKIVEENNKNHDIIQEDFIDNYRNMTYKHLMGYKWISTHCSGVKYVVKVDDDVLIDIYHLTRFLKQKIKENVVNKFLYGRLFKANSPHRFKGSKWYMPFTDYPELKYPDYCEGYAYITTPDVVQSLYQISLYFPYFWIDDVYVLGILRRQTDIKITSFKEPEGSSQMAESFASPRIKKVIFLLARWEHEKKYWFDIWKAVEKISKEIK